MTNPQFTYSLRMQVRDYEVDSQGIVNNAIYLHYFEHTRHEFCKKAGTSFRAMQEAGIDPVVREANVQYLQPLRLGDEFISSLRLERHGAKFVFMQWILTPAGEAVAKGLITIVSIKDGRLSRGDELAEYFNNVLSVND